MKKSNLKYAWLSDLGTYLEAVELAKKRGKKVGDNISDELMEIMRKNPKKFHMLGVTDMDLDMICGNLREKGLKVFNIKEAERKNKQ